MFSIDMDEYRIGEPWTLSHEKLAYDWKKRCRQSSNKHTVLGKKNKRKYIIFGFPCIVIPAVFGPVCVLLEGDKSLPYVSMSGFILNGLFAGITSFFNFSQKHQRHMEYAAIYDSIVTDIDYQISLTKKFREDPDAWLTRIQGKFDYTNKSAPDT